MAGVGGSGPSDKKMVGADKFVRHNPMSDKFDMLDFDHVEFWTGDASNTALRFAMSFGMQIAATHDLNTANQKYNSIVLQSGEMTFVFTAPYHCEAPPPAQPMLDTFPNYDRKHAWEFIQKHGMAVRAVGIKVKDAAKAYEVSTAEGAKGVAKPIELKDEKGTLKYSEVQFYDEVIFRFIQRDAYKGNFMPGYADNKEMNPKDTFGFHRIDHIVSNTPCLTDYTEKLVKVMGLHEFGEFTAADVGTVDSGLNSMVMANNAETILMPINEPTFGTRRKSQIQSFLEHHQGAGIQHLAIQTDDILDSMKKIQGAFGGGLSFMPAPGASYYEQHVPKKMGDMVSPQLINDCRARGILIDRDEEGGLLQIFTKPLLDRPTLFIELIQRIGCPLPGGRQKPACGGFGKGNFGALFKSIEDWEKERDGESVDKS